MNGAALELISVKKKKGTSSPMMSTRTVTGSKMSSSTWSSESSPVSQLCSSKPTRKCPANTRAKEHRSGIVAAASKTSDDKRRAREDDRQNHKMEPAKSLETALVRNLGQLTFTEKQNRSARPPRGSGVSAPKHSAAANPRRAPSQLRNLEDVARLIQQRPCRNIIVVAGAGISTASGIPDFRTPESGLYANLQKYNIPYPEAIFDIDYFTCDPQPFFSLAKELYPGCYRPNYVHYFVRMLHEKGLLLRMYTQNIDGLERISGIPEEKLVEAHGTFSSASCHLCYTKFPVTEAKKLILSNKVPRCKNCQGTVKPDVVFFGEDLPKKFFLHTKDFPKADLLIIMGTSLQIEPFASIVNTVKATVPRLLLNRDPIGPFQKIPLKRTDFMELGDLVDGVKMFARHLGWHEEIEDLIRRHECVVTNGHPSVSSRVSPKVPPQAVPSAQVKPKSANPGKERTKSTSRPAAVQRRKKTAPEDSSSSDSDTESTSSSGLSN
nr:PREDICTED: NAD-dependent protein deacetylase sirtuin-3-like isoform X1 [Lepisosteus oculatus]